MPIIDGHIRCYVCKKSKPLADFYSCYVKVGNGRCKPCARRVQQGGKEWNRTASRAERRRYDEARDRYYQKNKRKLLAAHQARRLEIDYGITMAEYESIYAAQKGCCACCGTPSGASKKRLHVDHDHATGVIRGLLCGGCNLGIGQLGDSIEGLRRALAYLERAGSRGQ